MAQERIILGMRSVVQNDYAKGFNESYEVLCLWSPADVCLFARRYSASTTAIIFEADFLSSAIKWNPTFIEDIRAVTAATIIVFCLRLYSKVEIEEISGKMDSMAMVLYPAPPSDVFQRALAIKAWSARQVAQQEAASQ